MGNHPNSISSILQSKLKSREPVTNKVLLVEDLFDTAKATDWIKRLLDCDGLSNLEKRADAAPERLTHAAAAYLLGLAVREGLDLNFDVLPRIFSHGAIGDAFHFFWSAISLCHDLGYQYEYSKCDLSLMDSSEGRCKLLEIHHDLFKLDAAGLADLGVEPGSETEWVLSILDLVKKYDRMRRRCEEEDFTGAVVDHGIAGALILYDILMDEYERFRPKELPRRRDPSRPPAIHSGELAAHAGHKRFAACAVIIACTVARHNMWTAEKKDADRYLRYGLSALCEGGSAARIKGDRSIEQLLFLLGFMDTIDPVKGLYTREAERSMLDSASLERRRAALLNEVTVCFHEVPRFSWGAALKYRALTISIQPSAPEDVRKAFSSYAKEVRQMVSWLDTKPPILTDSKENYVDSVTCYYPTFPRRKTAWAGGIQEQEITALCLYAGGGVGKADFFYQCRNAYQTFNLLMMEGFEGEKVRVQQEGQKPFGCYIQNWKQTLEVMTDILSAQYKFMEYDQERGCAHYTLCRVDRKVNFDMMCCREETFAFTSTSKAGFLRELARPKKNLVLLNIVLTCPVPFVDYERLLGRAYVYADEREILLPPFLKVLRVSEESLSDEERERFPKREEGDIKKYIVELGSFSPGESDVDEAALVEWLDAHKETAAGVLGQLCERRVPEEYEKSVYLDWKKHFQLLVQSCFHNIKKSYSIT